MEKPHLKLDEGELIELEFRSLSEGVHAPPSGVRIVHGENGERPAVLSLPLLL